METESRSARDVQSPSKPNYHQRVQHCGIPIRSQSNTFRQSAQNWVSVVVKLWYESSTNSANRYDSEFSGVLESRKSFVSQAVIIIVISQLYNRKYSYQQVGIVQVCAGC